MHYLDQANLFLTNYLILPITEIIGTSYQVLFLMKTGFLCVVLAVLTL